jgi:hypothetical protein
VLIFGTANWTVSINASYRTTDDKMAASMRNALFGVYYDPALPLDLFQGKPFRMNESNAVFGFGSFSDEICTYEYKAFTEDAIQPSLEVYVFDDQKKPLKAVLDNYMGAPTKFGIRNERPGTANGLTYLRREVYIADSYLGVPMLYYQRAVKLDHYILHVRGMAYSNFDYFIKAFEDLANSIKAQNTPPGTGKPR